MKVLLNVLTSLKLANALTLILLACLLSGSFVMVSEPATGSLNEGSLFSWLLKNDLKVTWWLWGAVTSSFLLGLNVLACSLESLLKGISLRRITPQLFHLGFGLILLAHCASFFGFKRVQVALAPGMSFTLPETKTEVKLVDLGFETSRGYVSNYWVEVFYDSGKHQGKALVAPNRPLFLNGYGVYLKGFVSSHAVVLEVTREPGVALALAGALVFLVGSCLLCWFKFFRR